MFGRTTEGRLVSLTDEQRMETPSEPQVLLVEKDHRERRLGEPRFRYHRWRAIVGMVLEDGTLVATGKAHGKTESQAIEKAKARCRNGWARGLPPDSTRSYGLTIKQLEQRKSQKIARRNMAGGNDAVTG